MTPEERLRRIEDRLALRELVARYALAIDDKDISLLNDLFTTDARFSFASGLVAEAVDREEVIDAYVERLALMGHSYHVVHDQVLTFPPAASNVAQGIVTAHAEMWRNGRVEIAAMRYNDSYRVDDGKWRISHREVAFFYYLPISDYARFFGETLRLRAAETPLLADFPERTNSWIDFWNSRKPD